MVNWVKILLFEETQRVIRSGATFSLSIKGNQLFSDILLGTAPQMAGLGGSPPLPLAPSSSLFLPLPCVI